MPDSPEDDDDLLNPLKLERRKRDGDSGDSSDSTDSDPDYPNESGDSSDGEETNEGNSDEDGDSINVPDSRDSGFDSLGHKDESDTESQKGLKRQVASALKDPDYGRTPRRGFSGDEDMEPNRPNSLNNLVPVSTRFVTA